MPPLFIDRHPVTTANYSAYRRATGYAPKDALNWLSNWRPGARHTAPLAGTEPTTGFETLEVWY